MRPYLSIIKDSFRAALASRVLYVLLVCITVLLLVLAPIWIKEDLAWEIREQHLRNPGAMCDRLADAGPEADEELVHHIWNRFSDDLKKELTKFREYDKKKAAENDNSPENPFSETGPIARQQMWEKTIGELNGIIKQEDFYQEEVFKDRYLPPEAASFIEDGLENLNTAQTYRLNRKLVEYSLGGFIREGPRSSLNFAYFNWTPAFLKFNSTRSEMKKTIANWLPWVLDKGVLSIGLLIAILITASLIPEMLQASSLNLLLSKPVTRWGLLIAKFVGGCAFVAILATYLFVGLWFLLGVRIGYWEKAILLSIPVYIFVFAIYFSVSTLIGVLFRNTIVSILLTLLFWVCCWAVGSVYGYFEAGMKGPKITKVIEANDDLFQVDTMEAANRWDKEKSKWELTLIDAENKPFVLTFYGLAFFVDVESQDLDIPPAIGPVYHPEENIVIRGQADMQRPETMHERKLTVSSNSIDWKVENVGSLPSNTLELYYSKDIGIIASTVYGNIYRLTENPLVAAENAKSRRNFEGDDSEESSPTESKISDVSEEESSDVSFQSSGPGVSVSMKTPSGKRSANDEKFELFEDISPERRIDNGDAQLVDFNPVNNEIAIYKYGAISILKWNGSQYEFDVEIKPEFDVDASMTAWLVYRGSTILVGLGNGEIITIDRNTYEELNTYVPENRSAIKRINGSFDGRWFTVTYRNGTLWYLDIKNPERMHRANVRGQYDISVGSFNNKNQLWVADRTNRITLYDPESWSRVETRTPNADTFTKIYRYGIKPCYDVFPKPGEFYKLISHVSDGSAVSYDRSLDLTRQPEPKNPWAPFRSSLIFLVVVLAISCFIFHRQEY